MFLHRCHFITCSSFVVLTSCECLGSVDVLTVMPKLRRRVCAPFASGTEMAFRWLGHDLMIEQVPFPC